jgi:hypothetical protein
MNGRTAKIKIIGMSFMGILMLCLAGCVTSLNDGVKNPLDIELSEMIEIYYFFDEICGTCVEEAEFYVPMKWLGMFPTCTHTA